jgi:succinate dehydrogenase / fumarate reductase cytochrome b subunit
MPQALLIHQTSLGKKAIVAVTGVIMFGFLTGHMFGNLQVFRGPEALNHYAALLKATAPLLWGTRIVVLTSVIAHFYFSMVLAAQSGDARPKDYQKRENNTTNLGALSMKLTGPTLALFVIYHLLHLTIGNLPNGAGAFSETDVWANVMSSFQIWWLAAIYIVAQLLLGLHLFHGAWSFFQTLGLSHPRYNVLRRIFAAGVTALIVGGNIAIPALIVSGVYTGEGQAETAPAAGDEAPVEARNIVVE